MFICCANTAFTDCTTLGVKIFFKGVQKYKHSIEPTMTPFYRKILSYSKAKLLVETKQAE